MQTLETDAVIGADGSVKLLSPLPAWLKPGRTHLLLVIDDAKGDISTPKRTLPTATPEMLARRKAAYAELRSLGGLTNAIPDPAAWQRETRQDLITLRTAKRAEGTKKNLSSAKVKKELGLA